MESRIERNLARGLAVDNHLRRGMRTFVALADGRVEATDRGVGIVWAVDGQASARVGRKRAAASDDRGLWSDPRGSWLIHLSDSASDVLVCGRSGVDGSLLWERDAASLWADAPAWLANSTLILGSVPDRCIVVAGRDGRPGACMAAVDPQTGALQFGRTYADAILECDRGTHFLGVFLRGCDLNDLLGDGSTRVLLKCPGKPASPLVLGDEIICAWRRGHQIGVARVDRRNGRVVARSEWERSGSAAPELLEVGGRVLLLGTQQHYSLLSETMTPLWEARLPHWFRDAAFRADGALVIETSGRTYALDAETGAEIARSRF